MVKYECLVKTPSRSLIVQVFTESTDKKTIKGKALIEASQYLKGLGVEHDIKDLKPIGFRNLGTWEVMPEESI